MGITCKPMGLLGQLLAKDSNAKQKEAIAERRKNANRVKESKGNKSKTK